MPELLSSPLENIYNSEGIRSCEYHGALVPSRFSDGITEHAAVRQAAGLIDFSFRTMFAARGSDRATFLHSMLSNDVLGLRSGQGTYATLLDVKGHILADLRVYRDHQEILLATDADLRPKAIEKLEHYIVMDDVTLEPLTLFGLAFQGPRCRPVLERVFQQAVPSLEREYDHCVLTGPGGAAVRVVKASNTGEEGYELWTDADTVREIWQACLGPGNEFKLVPCGTEAFEILRIEAGIPVYGAELGEDTLPLEAGLMHALSFTKGCYIGQEVVERTRSRGHVNWQLIGLLIEADAAPYRGDLLVSEGKHAGEITSACISPSLGRTIALAYARREISEPGTRLLLNSGVSAEVTPLPFYRRSP